LTEPRKLHEIWIEQCEAARTIKDRYGLKAAFDYLVGEKLLNFTEAASEHRAFAQELPRFVSEVRRMFTAEQIAGYPIALRLGSHVGRRGHVSCGADYGDAYDCIRKY